MRDSNPQNRDDVALVTARFEMATTTTRLIPFLSSHQERNTPYHAALGANIPQEAFTSWEGS
jgi:hypothetical protein